MEISGRLASHREARRSRILLLGMGLLGLGSLMEFPGLHAQQSTLLAEGTKALYQNDFARSEGLAAQFLRKRPRDPEGMVLLARAEMAQGKLDAAFETLTKALRTHPQHLDVLYYLGRLSLRLSHQQFEGLYAMAPDSMRSHQMLAEAAEARDDLSKAEVEYQEALQSDPKSVELLNALGFVQQRKFQFQEAIATFLKAAALQPLNFDTMYGLGSTYLHMQQPGRAAEFLRQAVKADSGSSAAHFALGDALLRMGHNEDAVASLQASLKIQPERRLGHILLARAYKLLGHSQKASLALDKASELQQKESKSKTDAQLMLNNPDSSSPPSSGGAEGVKPEP